MNVSIFTPSHNPQYLDQAYESLVAQTDADWEWLVLLNNGAKWRAPNFKDYRVRIIECGFMLGCQKSTTNNFK